MDRVIECVKKCIEQTVNENAVLRALLTLPSSNYLDAVSYDELCLCGVIQYAESERLLSDAEKNRVLILVGEQKKAFGNGNLISIDVICGHECWNAVTGPIRPLEIGILLAEALQRAELDDEEQLSLSTCQQLSLNESLAGYSFLFDSEELMQDNKALNALRNYQSILNSVLTNVFDPITGVQALMVATEEEQYISALSWKKLQEMGYVRLSPLIDEEPKNKVYLLVDFNISNDIGLNLSVIESRDCDRLENGKKRIKLLSAGIIERLCNTENNNHLSWRHINKLSDELLSCMMSFKLSTESEYSINAEQYTDINFFCDLSVITRLLEMNIEEGEYRDFDISVDITDLPFKCFLVSNETTAVFTMSSRSEFGCTNDECCRLSLDKLSGDVQISAPEEIAESVEAFLVAFMRLRAFSLKNRLDEQFEYINTEFEGIQLLDAGELKYKKVSGKDRPDLMCRSLFGITQMARPYQEDIAEDMKNVFTSEEEHIQKAEAGDQNEMELLAFGYLRGDNGCTEDSQKAAYWMERLAETGKADAQFNIGLFYAEGHGVNRDLKKALYWERLAKDNGDEDADELISLFERMLELTVKAAANEAEAQAELAELYCSMAGSLEEHGPEDDYRMCFELARQSAKQNCLRGIYVLALCYEYGRGTAQDSSKAAVVYRKAARQDHAPSQWKLACLYMNGDGIEKDKALAIEWATKAAGQGYKPAVEGLSQM